MFFDKIISFWSFCQDYFLPNKFKYCIFFQETLCNITIKLFCLADSWKRNSPKFQQTSGDAFVKIEFNKNCRE